MANVTDYLYQLQQLTEQNLSILQALQESFYTNSEHISVSVGTTENKRQFAIPSFLCLEDKINTLQANFENLVNAPKTGEAAFVFDGSTQEIQVKNFTNVPTSIGLTSQDTFYIDKNDVLKDMVTPNPYLKLDLTDIANDITKVSIKKIILKDSNLKKQLLPSDKATMGVDYTEVRSILDIYEEDKDYIEYDTIQTLPVHKPTGGGEYTIFSIEEDTLDDDFKETYKIRIRNNLTYLTENNTVEKYLQVGDTLVNYNDTIMLTITDINFSENIITVQVGSGRYVNLTAESENNAPEFCKLKFYSTIDFEKDKYVKVTLEEDDNCIIFVNTINNLNIQSNYASGLSVNTALLTCNVDGAVYNYLDYYKSFVNNIGDTVYGLSSMINNTINNTSAENFNIITTAVPELATDTLQVVNINAHLNDSEKLENIRSVYSQKKASQQDLETIQTQINEINTILQTNTFEDLDQSRTSYEEQLNDLLAKKTKTTEYIKSLVNDISVAANEAVIPIEGAKYRVRGYFDYANFLTNNNIDFTTVVKLRVQYRYKNQDSTTGTLKSIDDNFVFTEWTELQVPGLIKFPSFGTDNRYHFDYSEDTMLENEISFNQIDIPITQGEKVEIRVKAIYDLGYPFIECASVWSKITTVEFPEEMTKNIQILDIIEENNNEVKKNQLNDILEKNGTIKHVNDSIQDQDILYLHKPASIASGFYTEERRMIPLYDKLYSMHTDILRLHDEVFSVNQDTVSLKLTCDNRVINITPNTNNIVYMPAYSSSEKSTAGVVSKLIKAELYNKTSHTIKLFSLFPGNYQTYLQQNSTGNAITRNYTTLTIGQGSGGKIIAMNILSTASSQEIKAQLLSQILYFRINKPYDTGTYLVVQSNGSGTEMTTAKEAARTNNVVYGDAYANMNTMSLSKLIDANPGENILGATMFPQLFNYKDIQIQGSGDGFEYMSILPRESISFNIIFEYKLEEETLESIQKTMSIDLRTSLYKDPINYEITIQANKDYNKNEELQISQTNRTYEPTQIN